MSRKEKDQFPKNEIVERLGGREAVVQSMETLESVHRRFEAERSVLLEEYPYKWAIIGEEGLLAVRDTFQETREYVRDYNLKNPGFLVKYLDPNPPVLIL